MPINGEIMFDSVEIDGVEISISDLDTAQGTYVFNTSGEHTVKYVPKDPTLVGIISYASEEVTGATFANCPTLTSITIPNSVTVFGNAAFYNCSGLSRVNIPNGVTGIGLNTFNGCASITNIIMPDGVTFIDSSAFEGCTSLTNMTIGSGVTYMGSTVFSNCTSLETITSLATTAPTIIGNTFQNIKTNGTLTVPSGSTGYDVWMDTGNYYLGKYNWTKVEQ